MAKTIVGLFDYEDDARNAVRDLLNAGFKQDDVSILANHSESRYGTSTTVPDAVESPASSEAAAEGVGAVIGGLTGFALGLGTFAIPGFGPILAAGWIGPALAGAGIGALTGGLIGALVSAGVPEEHAHTYAEGVSRGGLLVLVRSEDQTAEQAAAIMQENAAVDIDRRSGRYQPPEPKPVEAMDTHMPDLSRMGEGDDDMVRLSQSERGSRTN